MDLTKTLLNDLKKNIFEIIKKLDTNPQFEDAAEIYYFHALKISNKGDVYSIIDASKDRKYEEVSNKYLLYLVLEDLLKIESDLDITEEEEREIDALASSMIDQESGEPVRENIEIAEEIIKESFKEE